MDMPFLLFNTILSLTLYMMFNLFLRHDDDGDNLYISSCLQLF